MEVADPRGPHCRLSENKEKILFSPFIEQGKARGGEEKEDR
jgi:hypothetical protein